MSRIYLCKKTMFHMMINSKKCGVFISYISLRYSKLPLFLAQRSCLSIIKHKNAGMVSMLQCDYRQYGYINNRMFHNNIILFKDESKVEQTVKALKESDKKEKEVVSKPLKVENISGVVDDNVAMPVAPVPKKKLMQKIIDELKHYYHGFRLLFIDVKVCTRFVWLVLNGKSLSRRERRQLVRTTSDLFRLVPFLVFVIVPFMEFLLPVALKLFPNMLPSTFKDENRETEKVKKKLKVRLEMAKFLQDTIEDTALQKKKNSKNKEEITKIEEFHNFIESIRKSGNIVSNEQILKFSKLFEDDITLDSLSRDQLQALCRLLGSPAIGNNTFLRFQLRMKLRQLETDDRMIQKEGINSLTIWELQDACRARGMRAHGMSETRLKSQLSSWLDLHLNNQVPTSLLLLSRTLFMFENLSPEEQIAATISELPNATANSAKIKITEVIGERIDNKTKLELIKEEEKALKEEAKEKEVEAAKKMDDALDTTISKTIAKQKEIIVDKAEELKINIKEELIDTAPEIVEILKSKEEISQEDLEKIENVLETIANEKLYAIETKELKDDVEEYDRDLAELKDVVLSTGLTEELQETKAAQRLRAQVNKLVSEVDTVVEDLYKEKTQIIEAIEVKEVKMKRNLELQEDEKKLQDIQNQIDEKKEHLITINELMLGMKRLQKLDDETKFQKIVEVLDEDGDGAIDLEHAMKVLELLGKENVKIDSSHIAEIVQMLQKEALLNEKQKKDNEKVEKEVTKNKQNSV